MIRIVLSFLLMALWRGQAQTPEPCPVDFETVFVEQHAALLDTEDTVFVDDPGYADLFADFSAEVAAALAACDDPDTDFTFIGEYEGNPDLFNGYDLRVSVTPLDVNLDDANEWLVWIQVGDYGYANGQAYMDLYAWDDDTWQHVALWPAEPVTAELAEIENGPRYTLPLTPNIYPDADVDGRTYMRIAFRPGIGSYYHVDGLWVVRWDGFTPETALFIPQGCVFAGSLQVGADGQLYMPVSGGAVPWEGCTAPPEDAAVEDGQPIPGAVMSND